MREEIVHLHPRGAFHLGERGIGLEETADVIHADTLHAALCVAWATLFDQDEMAAALLKADDPPLLLSSAFPFAGPVRFYPRPLLPLAAAAPLDPAFLRQLKEVRFVSEGVLCRLLGERAYPQAVEAIHGGTALLLADEAEALRAHAGVRTLEGLRFWEVSRVPRVALDVRSGRSNIWHFGRVAFRQGAGFFFRVRYRDEALADRFRAAVRLLGDTGLGGDRSSGHGLFRATFEPAEPLGEANADHFVTLAPVYPPRDQVQALLGPDARYHWLTRGGWIGGATPTPYRRRGVRLLAEGAFLAGRPAALWGALADVTPEETPEPLPHRVYRYGFAFPVGVSP